jgi:hypothetical protein
LDDDCNEQWIDPDWINVVPPVMRTHAITGDDLRTRAQAYYAQFIFNQNEDLENYYF